MDKDHKEMNESETQNLAEFIADFLSLDYGTRRHVAGILRGLAIAGGSHGSSK